MITFILGILILFLGYIFYSKYINNIFEPSDKETPANVLNDGVDFVPMSKVRNSLIHFVSSGREQQEECKTDSCS